MKRPGTAFRWRLAVELASTIATLDNSPPAISSSMALILQRVGELSRFGIIAAIEEGVGMKLELKQRGKIL